MDKNIIMEFLVALAAATLPVVGAFLCRLLGQLAGRIKAAARCEEERRLVSEIDRAVQAAVAYVNQTYVDSLKNAGKFAENGEYAENAFRQAYSKTIEILTEDAVQWMEAHFGGDEGMRDYLTVKIEESVRYNKA